MAERSNISLVKETAAQAAERIYHEWDAALGAKDLDAAMALYAPDCMLESPLVRHLLGAELGIVEGREKLREFVRIVFERQPAARQRYREDFFTDGHKLMWEYPRSRPGGEQMDFVEVMEIEDGLMCLLGLVWGKAS
jgi:hypothetical protein